MGHTGTPGMARGGSRAMREAWGLWLSESLRSSQTCRTQARDFPDDDVGRGCLPHLPVDITGRVSEANTPSQETLQVEADPVRHSHGRRTRGSLSSQTQRQGRLSVCLGRTPRFLANGTSPGSHGRQVAEPPVHASHGRAHCPLELPSVGRWPGRQAGRGAVFGDT